MHSPGQGLAVQGRGAQAAALADALASLRRTRARMASLTAYDKDVSSGSYNLSSATTGSYYSCVSQITIGYDVAGPVAIGLTHWKNPYVQGRPTLPSDLPLFLSKDAGIPVYHQSFTRKADLATPLSCPASLSITPVPSYSSSSQETLSQDTTVSPQRKVPQELTKSCAEWSLYPQCDEVTATFYLSVISLLSNYSTLSYFKKGLKSLDWKRCSYSFFYAP